MFVPHPRISLLIAFVVATRPYAFLDPILPELKDVTAWTASFPDLVRPEFPSGFDIVTEVVAGVFVFETVSNYAIGPRRARLPGLVQQLIRFLAL
jgi:hypothetical protein